MPPKHTDSAINLSRFSARAGSPSDRIFDALREAIFAGELTDGEHLRQDQLATLFDTSRIPVREALVKLEQQGLVVTERFRGTTVATLSATEISEIFEFRALIEGEIIFHSVANMSAKTLALAKEHCDAFASESNANNWGPLNRNFHYALYADANRPYHQQVIMTTLDRVERYLRAQLSLTDGMERARSEHLGILQACVNRDADLAAKRSREHILGASRSLIAFLDSGETRGDSPSDR